MGRGGVRRGDLPDAVSWLTFYAVVLFAIPSRLVVAPLGAAGSPSQIIGLSGLAWWSWHHLSRSTPSVSTRQPVRAALGIFLLCVGVSYASAMAGPIEADEVSAADLGLLGLLAWCGVALTASDGIPSRERLDVFVRRLAMAGGILALFGLVQFVAHRSFVDLISIPGLSPNHEIGSGFGRVGFARPSGTAIHPIEYGVVLTMLLPLALHQGFFGSPRGLILRWFPAGAIGLIIALSLSRSAIVGAAVCASVLIPSWPARRRRGALFAIGSLVAVVFVSVPGLLGGFTGLFTGIGGDPSAQSRTGSYEIAWEFIRREFAFGRGLGTFLPRYRILDNQLLLLLIEVGIVGLAAFLLLVLVAVLCMRAVRQTASDPKVRDLAQALVAALASGTIGMAFFDAFSFPMAAGMLFLVLGLMGALFRLASSDGSL